MKTKLTLVVSALALLLGCGVQSNGASSVKSEYPLDYPAKRSCQEKGPLYVCRAIQMFYGLPAIDIMYTGNAIDTSKGAAVFVKIHYENGDRQGLFQAVSPNTQQTNFRVTGGCLVGKLGGCEKQGTAEMRDLLEWAARYDHTLNAIDFEVAVTDNNGHWDSHNGANYQFHFDQE